MLKPARFNNSWANIYTNECPSTVNAEGLKPDLVIEDNITKKVMILDLAITTQSRMEGRYLQTSREHKINKYRNIADQYQALGYNVELNAVIFGNLGGTDDINHNILRKICTEGQPNSVQSANKYAYNMHKYIVVSVLRSAYSMWIQRCRPRQ